MISFSSYFAEVDAEAGIINLLRKMNFVNTEK